MKAETFMAWGVKDKSTPTQALQQKSTDAIPTPGPDDVVIRNEYIGLNPVDWKVIQNWPVSWATGHIPGVDGAGTVVEVGENVRGVVPGQRIAYHQDLHRNGSFASHTVVTQKTLLRVPDILPLSLAVALPCPLMTAWQAIEKIPRMPEADVLITGAGGMVGRFLVQLAVQRNYRVTAMASARHHKTLRQLGAETTIGWNTQQSDSEFFAVFDTVNAQHASSMAGLVEANGHIVCIQDRLETPPLPAFDKALSLHEVALNGLFRAGSDRQWAQFRQAGEDLLTMVAREKLRAPEPHIEPMTALPEALEELTTQDRPLKTVIDVRHFTNEE
ncbi:zinc-binding dehydrogenase [Marinobacter sp. CA1]|uniref:zinc-binding dehydrogenase n=1 Tax=Marinobacter sp. CA1 TaxID=2817656 RepID=UPI001D083FFB|nr:zinc-binding dehydrogenase [Marinobacter sp. CA1]UDL07046.1 zinc-binding dehydrogenase [Marinobacter sp. CA1]